MLQCFVLNLRWSPARRSRGVIFFMIDNTPFPARSWEDDPLVLLAWWTEALRIGRGGAVAPELRFASGPYSVVLHLQNGQNSQTSIVRSVSLKESGAVLATHATSFSLGAFARSVRSLAQEIVASAPPFMACDSDLIRLRHLLEGFE